MSEKKFLDLEGLSTVAQKVNSRLKSVTEMPASASDGAIRLYVGETDEYTKGHIYQYSEENEQWIDISPAGSGDGWEVVETMPASAPNGTVVLFNGHSTVQYAHGGVYRMTSGSWEFLGALVQIVEVPFTLSFDSITAIASGDTKRTLTFTASEETSLTEETFSGITANGVIQGKFWNDIGGSISQIDETHFKVELDTNVADSLGQLAQFPSGSSVTIPGFSWIDGITRYVHQAETITISETVVSQKLAFNTTGTLDTSTQATVFGISSAYEVPFVLSYENIPTVTMIDSNYENEVTQSWVPSIVAANDTTNLVFTPNDSTALHGDDIAVTAGTLTAVSNGVTYTYDFSTDNINLKWGNTTWSFGVYNNFASFTAAPTSANTGSATLTLNPTGPGATARELAFMANLLPTVTIDDNGDTKEFANVAWTQGSMVVSGASEVTSVANKLITVTWSDDVTSDFDAYGVECFVNVNALSLSATCAYIDHNITFSSPVLNHTSGETDVQVELTASESLPSTLFADYTEVTLRTRAVLQGRLITSDSAANATASGTSFYLNEIPNLVDSLGQRAVYATGSNVVIGAFEYIDGDDKYIHASQTINASETLTTQKLAFNTTGTLDSSTGVTTFVINASNVVPFVLNTSDTFSVTMLAAGYGAETTVTWTPSINYGDSDTELIFTPNNTTALHGDNITFANKVLNFVSNGVTYEIDTSEDTLNVRWANTSYDFGTFNNFASFTAVPTSANSGSVTCTLSPTGPGDDQFELDIMSANLPTVTIDSVQCGTVAWTQGQIVASGASGVTTVGGKTVDITWAGGNYSDTDNYGIARTVTFAAKALSATCAYIQQTIVLSSPTPSTSNNALSMAFTTDVTASTTYTLASSDYSASATGVLQASATTVSSNGTATYTGTSFTINSFANSTDVFSQRVVFPSGYDSVTVGSFDFIFGDYELIHSSQTLSCTESTIAEQELNMNDTSNYTINYSGGGWRYFSLPSKFSALSGGCLSDYKYVNSSLEAATATDSMVTVQRFDEGRSFSCGASDKLFWGSLQPITFKPTSAGVHITTTCLGVTWKISNQTIYVEPKGRKLQWSLSGTTSVASVTSDNSYDTCINLYGISGYEDPFKAYVLSSINRWTVTVGGHSETITPTNIEQLSNPLALRLTKSNYYPEALKGSGTTTIVFNTVSQTYEVPNSDGFTVEYTCPGGTVTGTHSYDEYYDDDDCDDD